MGVEENRGKMKENKKKKKKPSMNLDIIHTSHTKITNLADFAWPVWSIYSHKVKGTFPRSKLGAGPRGLPGGLHEKKRGFGLSEEWRPEPSDHIS